MPAKLDWSTFDDLDSGLRARLAGAGQATATLPSGPDTFLYSVRKAMQGPESKSTKPIVYNGKRYALTTEKQIDRRSGGQLWRLDGSIKEEHGRDCSAFQLWFATNDPAGLPTRIEFHPKSFLKLVLERDDDSAPADMITRNRYAVPVQALR
jgi:hypothetical protein